MLCLSLTGSNCEISLSQYEKHKEVIQLVELRIDYLDSIHVDEINNLLKSISLPVIATYRRKRDGGLYEGPEKARLQVLKDMLDLDFTYVDIEDDIKRLDLEDKARGRSIKIIRSLHDMEKVPKDLFLRIMKLHKKGDIAKIAVMPRSLEDVMMIFKVNKELKDIPDKVIIGMGEFGIPTRILYKKTGSLFTFCSPEGEEAASGHLTPEIMHDLYHADRVNENTKVFGIIGNPVMHTSSPKIHNPAFYQLGLNSVYVPFLVDDVRAFFQLADLLSIQGFSVTVPFKQQVLPYLGKISREVKLIGSCNTVFQSNRVWKGVNTDFYGFLKPIQEELDSQRIRTALVLGAGGAARSIVWALRNYYCRVVIVNRTAEKAKNLAGMTGSSWRPVEELGSIHDIDIVVQTTSGGMSPYEDVDPSLGYEFTGKEIAYDLVYKPKNTRFLTRAEKAGCRQICGMDMLIAQGVLQFESFTGFLYPQKKES